MGFGPSVPAPSWGGLIAAASQHVYDDPWLMVPTGVVLALTVIAANVLADTVAATRAASASASAATPPASAARTARGHQRACRRQARRRHGAAPTRTRCSTSAT